MATIEQEARFNKALPKPGDRIRENYGAGHMATWKTAGKVLAVLDGGQCIVIRRYSPRTGHQYQTIHRIEWCVRPFEICPKRKEMSSRCH